jgi:hypothetical protein
MLLFNATKGVARVAPLKWIIVGTIAAASTMALLAGAGQSGRRPAQSAAGTLCTLPDL